MGRGTPTQPSYLLVFVLLSGCAHPEALYAPVPAPPPVAAQAVAPPPACECPCSTIAADPAAGEAPPAPKQGVRIGIVSLRAPDNLFPLMLGTDSSSAPLPGPTLRRAAFRQTQVIRVGQTHLSTADVTDDGAHLLAVSEDEALVRVYDERGALVTRFAVPGYSQFGRGSFSFYPGAGRPRVLAATEQGISLYDGLSGDLLAQLSDQPTWETRWVLSRRILLANLSDIGTQTSRLALFEASPDGTLTTLAELMSDERIDGVDLSDDGRLLALSTYPSNRVRLLDLAARRELWSVEGPQYVRPVDLSPDGRYLAMGGDRLVVLDTADPSRRAELTGYGNNLHEVRFLESSLELATTSYDGRVRIVALDQTRPALRLVQTLRHAGTANVYSLVVRRGGDELLTSSGDKTVRRFVRSRP